MASTGQEVFDITGLEAAAPSPAPLPEQLTVTAGGKTFDVVLRLDTPVEAEYYRHGGILPYVLRSATPGACLIGGESVSSGRRGRV